MGNGTDGHSKRRRAGSSSGPGVLERLGPLRKIVTIIRHAETIFDTSRVAFECGHEGSVSSGATYRGRCRRCRTAPQLPSPTASVDPSNHG